MSGDVDGPGEGSSGAPVRFDHELRAGLAELEDYLEGMADERLGELVLPFAARWVLGDTGLDVDRLRDEAAVFVQATPVPDRILAGYGEQVAYWISMRMLVDRDEQPLAGGGRAELERARSGLERRAALVECEGFPRVAGAFRRLLEETAGGSPPADLLWNALARRIADSVLG